MRTTMLRHRGKPDRVEENADVNRDVVTMRFSSPEDRQALNRLAQLDSAPVPTGPSLVAEVAGELVAALPLDGGRPIADPFRHTTGLVRLLGLRVAQLKGENKRGAG